MEIDVEEVQNAVINSKLIRIKALEKAKAIIDEEIQIYRNGIEMEMNIAGYKSKDFDLAKVTLSDDVKYNQIMTLEEIENEVGEDYTKRTIDRAKLQKEIPTMHDKAFEKEIKGQKLMIKMK